MIATYSDFLQKLRPGTSVTSASILMARANLLESHPVSIVETLSDGESIISLG